MKNIENVQKLIEKGQKVLSTHIPNSPGIIGYPTLDLEAFSTWQTQCLNFLELNLPADSAYFSSFRDKIKHGYRGTVDAGIEILTSVKEDLEVEGLIH
ncbi:MAG: hypothetical protein H8D23_16180 [Candidatus Brocadiales bacterium]|nr:hypothetical protein [Candidatus Brocadiales bacterium]